jgi:hypothetical protein
VSSAVADPPAAPAEQQATAANGGPPPDSAGAPAPARTCSSCGAALADGQDWCLSCGAGAPDSLGSRTPTWRSAAVLLTALAVLVAGAAGAAYAALDEHGAKAPAATTVAQVPPTTATPPATTTPPAATAPLPRTPKIGTPTTIKPAVPLPKVKIPITPTVTPTPKATTPITPSNVGGETTPTTTTPKGSGEGSPVGGEAHPEALLLDTDAAQTYNPYNYPASNFGDPSLAIDGDTTTGWTALVEPSAAPKLAEGLAIDLNTPRRLSAVALTTSTPGMTVQVYGSDAAALPTSITDPAWAALTPSFVERKRHVRIKLGHGAAAAAAKKPYRFITLWISQAPASAVGTPQAPGHVAVDELELFPSKAK